MATYVKDWSKETNLIREIIKNIDKKIGTSIADECKISFNNKKGVCGTFARKNGVVYFSFSLCYFNNNSFRFSDCIDTIRHEYAHYLRYELEVEKYVTPKKCSPHDIAWKYAAKLVKAIPKAIYFQKDHPGKTDEQQSIDSPEIQRLIKAEDIVTIDIKKYVKENGVLPPLKMLYDKNGNIIYHETGMKIKENVKDADFVSNVFVPGNPTNYIRCIACEATQGQKASKPNAILTKRGEVIPDEIAALKYLEGLYHAHCKEFMNINDKVHITIDPLFLNSATKYCVHRPEVGGKESSEKISRKKKKEEFEILYQLSKKVNSNEIGVYVGNGILRTADGSINHPIISRPMSIKYDSINTEVSIVDIPEAPTNLVLKALSANSIDTQCIKQASEKIENIYPLGEEATTFLKDFAGSSSQMGRAIYCSSFDDAEAAFKDGADFIIIDDPIIYFDYFEDDINNFIIDVITGIKQNTKKMSKPLMEIIGLDQNQKSTAVEVVKGPPGTGKSFYACEMAATGLKKGERTIIVTKDQKKLDAILKLFDKEVLSYIAQFGNEKCVEDVITNYINVFDTYSIENAIKTKKDTIEATSKLIERQNHLKKIIATQIDSIKASKEAFLEEFPIDRMKLLINAEEMAKVPGTVSPECSISQDEIDAIYSSNDINIGKVRMDVVNKIPTTDMLKNKLSNFVQSKLVSGLKDICFYFNLFENYPWMSDATTDINNEYREVNQMLIEYVTAYKGANQRFNRAFHMVKVNDGISNEAIKDSLFSLSQHIEKNGKLTRFASNNVKRLYHGITINGNPLSTSADFALVGTKTKLNIMAMNISCMWTYLFDESEKDFLDIAEDVNAIEKVIYRLQCALEYKAIEGRLKIALEKAGYSFDEFFELYDQGNEHDGLEKIIKSKAIIEKKYEELREAEKSAFETEVFSKIKQLVKKSGLPKDEEIEMIQAIDTYDIQKYEEKVDKTFEKYRKRMHVLREREKNISKLATYAPELAKAITEKINPHDKTTAPTNLYNIISLKKEIALLESGSSITDQIRELEKIGEEIHKTEIQLGKWSLIENILNKTTEEPQILQALMNFKKNNRLLGKGTGRNARLYKEQIKNDLKKLRGIFGIEAMTIKEFFLNVDCSSPQYDMMIIDEAESLPIEYAVMLNMANKVVILGDDEQNGTVQIGTKVSDVEALKKIWLKTNKLEFLRGTNYKENLFEMAISLSSIHHTMLTNHYRCNSDIIQFSNKLSYRNKLMPMRSNISKYKPVVGIYCMNGEYKPNKTNLVEAQVIAKKIAEIVDLPEYEGKSIGVISLLSGAQSKLIEREIQKTVSIEKWDKHNITVGNVEAFQGHEFDIVFISTVVAPKEDGELITKLADGNNNLNKRMLNVCFSRAIEQEFIVHSFTQADIKIDDMRQEILRFVYREEDNLKENTLTPLEETIKEQLEDEGLQVFSNVNIAKNIYPIVVMNRNGNITVVDCLEREASHINSVYRAKRSVITIKDLINARVNNMELKNVI